MHPDLGGLGCTGSHHLAEAPWVSPVGRPVQGAGRHLPCPSLALTVVTFHEAHIRLCGDHKGAWPTGSKDASTPASPAHGDGGGGLDPISQARQCSSHLSDRTPRTCCPLFWALCWEIAPTFLIEPTVGGHSAVPLSPGSPRSASGTDGSDQAAISEGHAKQSLSVPQLSASAPHTL